MSMDGNVPIAQPEPGGPAPEIVHIAGADIRMANRLRQRCAWCGAVLIDYDLERIAMAVESGQPPMLPSMWPVGALIAQASGMSWVVRTLDESLQWGPELPEQGCYFMPHDLTGNVHSSPG